jgi:epoxyqueuosine reductase
MGRILLHTCCGPCTVYPLQRLREQNWTVHGFFYNPNIHPYQEFQRRLEGLHTLAGIERLELIVRPDYDLEGFFRQVAFREHERCIYCYASRLETTARLAKKSRFDAFTTTLLYSRQQKHDLVFSLAREASSKHGIPFFYEDFRTGWKEGQERARQLALYRQQYCGCIYSEKERFYGKAQRANG